MRSCTESLHSQPEAESLQLRLHGDASLPTLIYLPGLHGDWTLVSSFRAAVAGRVRFVEFTYPRTTTWSLDDYADATRVALLERGVTRGWLLGESFGSQIVWPLLARSGREFQAEGVILAGGFVRYPVEAMVRFAQFMSTRWPRWFFRSALFVYGRYARLRHRRAPETLASIGEFTTRRLEPLDRLAIRHRLGLIAENDPRPIARQTRLPVFALVGLVDPIVPAIPVRRWLQKNCPGYRTSRLIWRADHNVLGTAPNAAAEQLLQWIKRAHETKAAALGEGACSLIGRPAS
ncbi:MAG: alpha/beta hydrolase [Verrucomicrobia bacterium]|nr:alpha/beta hydrolase [Verrucomicrobiota bacterium]